MEVDVGSPRYANHDLQFYDHGCGGTFGLEVLQRLCVERLETLGVIRRIVAQNKRKSHAECRRTLKSQIEKRNSELFADLRDGIVGEERLRFREMDSASHQVLRLLLVQDDETRFWFLELESYLFRWRLEALDERGISDFRAINDITYPSLGAHDKYRLKRWLAPSMDDDQFDTTKFYEVPVFEVPDLLKDRSVHVERGVAYITELQFRSLLSHQFQRRLARMLELSIGAKYYLNDPRMEFLDKRLRMIYQSLRPGRASGDVISIGDLDELSRTSYPPCMRTLHESLQSRCHLRNGGRVQYTLFLKSAGLKAEDALEFYRDLFTRKITPEQFQKEYSYQFRHLYGLVGARKDYGNQECVRIAEEAHLGPMDCHGCFFANRDIEDLDRALERWQIPADHAREMACLAETGEYGSACAAYFRALHGTAIPSPIVRPDDFFRQSRKMIKARIRDDDCFADDDNAE